MTASPLLAAPADSSPHALTYEAVRAATAIVRASLAPSPLLAHPLLDLAVGAEVLVKHEHVLPTGSFKVRGGIHLAATLTERERRAGLITTSTGNHAQSVAYGARMAGVAATVVMPACAPEVKRAAVRALGARVLIHPGSLGEAAQQARALAEEEQAGYIDPTDARIILGHATAYAELFEEAGHLDAVYVPIGSGTGAAGACVVRDAVAPDCAVIAVQSAAAPAGWRSWQAGEIRTAPATTRASGLATTTGYAATLATLSAGLADFRLVEDDDIDAAARLLAERAGTLAEGAGAAALAGLLAVPAPGKRVAVMCTGGNASAEEIARLAAADV